MRKVCILFLVIAILGIIGYVNSKEYLKTRVAFLLSLTSSHEEKVLGVKTLLFIER